MTDGQFALGFIGFVFASVLLGAVLAAWLERR